MAEITTTAQFFDPEVLAPIVNNGFQSAMALAPLADVDTTLVGKAGDTITVPVWSSLGAAVDVPEGTDIPLEKLSQSTSSAKVTKIGKGVAITDEAILNSVGNAMQFATTTLANSIAQQVDNKLLAAALASSNVVNDVTLDIDGIDQIRTAFAGSQSANPSYTIIASQKSALALSRAVRDYSKGTDTGVQLAMTGALPLVLGASVFITNKVPDDKLVVVYSSDDDIAAPAGSDINTGKAFKIYSKRDLLIETARNASAQINNIYASKIFAPYVQNPSKVLVANVKASN